jgi:outer membrane scaffolding protein for murein synthesis (MipA/OmpV family)
MTTLRAWRAVLAASVTGLALLAGAREANAQSLERISTSLTDTLQSAIDLLPEGVTNVRIGAGPGVYSAFEGSRDYGVHLVPVVSFKYRNLVEVVNNEIHVTAFNRLFTSDPGTERERNTRYLRAGPLVSINFGRGENDNPALKGLGDVGTSFELGAFVAYVRNDDRWRVRARQDVADGHRGATMQLDYTHTFLRGPRISFSAAVGLEMATSVYLKSFFGVDAAQSQRSGLPQFHPSGGLKDGNLTVNGSYALSDHWTLFLNAGYEHLLGDAAASPLIKQRGSPNVASASTFVVYTF